MNVRRSIEDEWGLYMFRKSGGGNSVNRTFHQIQLLSPTRREASNDWTESGVNDLVRRPDGDPSPSRAKKTTR